MKATNLASLDYTLILQNRWGRLDRPVEIETDLFKYDVVLKNERAHAVLSADGTLRIEAGTEWDFGSGPAVDTPAMVRASLVHDMFCIMTGEGLLPWSARAYGDKLFRQIILQFSPERPWYNPFTYWYWMRWAGVSLNSQLVARWSAKPYEAKS